MGAGSGVKYSPDKLSANEVMGFQAGKTNYQMNTPAGLYTLATLGMGPGGIGPGVQDLAGQNANQKQLRQVKPQYEQEAESQGLQARQQSIASGTGGGGVQTASDVGAYNRVMAQYAALRQALEMQRLQQQQQMYGSMASAAGAFYSPGVNNGANGSLFGSNSPTPGLNWMGSGS